ncbi:hypothetical protein E8E13_001373 [Curvularia kusanoi]|uniref:Ankyrin repeat protein n=1 Tax=Curvularia kusanoi TaxID=90978 RepID=A0A9P4T554_CURKU|nr:hypothetical protein E8E13_001373 [Curvularia kusanoi]
MSHTPEMQARIDEWKKSGRRSALIAEPLSIHSTEEMLAACRAAIANGEDVNAPDTHPHRGYNEGRPLDACLRQTHMASSKSLLENIPVIELLLEHGADPRLHHRSVGPVHMPILIARRYASDDEDSVTDEARAKWKHILRLFEEAIVRLDAKKQKVEEP